MAGLQRSAVSFRRQGSSGLVWDDRFLSGELNQVKHAGDGVSDAFPYKKGDADAPRKSISSITAAVPPPAIDTLQRSRSNGGVGRGGSRGYRTGKVLPAMEPPSPKVSACGFCSSFGKKNNDGHKKSKKQPAAPKRRSR